MRLGRINRLVAVAASAALALGLAACGTDDAAPETTPDESPAAAPSDDESQADEGADDAAAAGTIETESNLGVHTIAVPPESVVALDNRSFAILDEWGVELSAAAVSLMRPDLGYKDAGIADIGNHREPNLELIVAAQPDLVVSGQRFTQYNEDIAALVPGATVVDYSPRDGEDFGAELKRHVTELGRIFGKEAEAQADVDEFDAAVARVQAAYDSSQTVLGVITSGGEINFAAPTEGRSVGPAFDILGLTPALTVDDASSNHEGDDISVEAIADSNPDWILVLDRDAATSANSGETYTPANELLAGSAALQNVTAVQEGRIVYMPQFTYLDEGIGIYTEFFNSIAEAMEQA
ncbi:MAG: ABC transporter substrate-binding protein [Propionibacterium sp.]|nr:ABC transporter substrate-binding protein [Propionibacterium sp.]